MQELTQEQAHAWRKRALKLDLALSWVRHELKISHIDEDWAQRALSMIGETEEEFEAFCRKVEA